MDECMDGWLAGWMNSWLGKHLGLVQHFKPHIPGTVVWMDHVTLLLKKLHWLLVEARIRYKIATLAFRHFENFLPPYLSELLHTYQPSRTLRSSSEKTVETPQN